MNITSINATAFYKEASKTGSVWAIRDKRGIPTPTNADGEHAIPFWSTRERAINFLAKVEVYNNFTPLEIPWDIFVNSWVPGLTNDDLLVGLNWTGGNADGYETTPEELLGHIEVQV